MSALLTVETSGSGSRRALGFSRRSAAFPLPSGASASASWRKRLRQVADGPRHHGADAAACGGDGETACLRRDRPSFGLPETPAGPGGKRIAMILQDPKYSLNPVMSIGRQIVETLRRHEKVGRAEARERALDMLAAVQIRDASRVFDLYPHEVSGGMGQRAMIAMMLVAGPELLIADEPTSALDVTVQLEVLAILDKLVEERGMGLIFVSHDLRLVSSFCDRVLVMYAGRIVEEIAASELGNAKHPYTRGLLNCMPVIGADRHPLPVLDRKPEWAL